MFAKSKASAVATPPALKGLVSKAGNRSSLYSSSSSASASTATNVSDGFDSESDISDADNTPPAPVRAPPVPTIPNGKKSSVMDLHHQVPAPVVVGGGGGASGGHTSSRRTSKRASSAPTRKNSRSPEDAVAPKGVAPAPPAPPPAPKAPSKQRSGGHRRAKSYCGEGFRVMEGNSSTSDSSRQTKHLVAGLSTWLANRRTQFSPTSSPSTPSSSTPSSSSSSTASSAATSGSSASSPSSSSGSSMTPAQVEEFVSHLATHIGLTDQELVLMRIYLAKYTSKFSKASPPPLPFGIQILCAAYLSQVLSYDDPLAKELWIVYSRCTWESFIAKVMDFSTVLDFSLAVPAEEFNYMYARMLDLHDEPRPDTWSSFSPSPNKAGGSSKVKPPPPPIVPKSAALRGSSKRTPSSSSSRSGTAPPPRRRSDDSLSSSSDPPPVAPAPRFRAASCTPTTSARGRTNSSRSASSGHGRKHSLFSAFHTGQYRGPTSGSGRT